MANIYYTSPQLALLSTLPWHVREVALSSSKQLKQFSLSNALSAHFVHNHVFFKSIDRRSLRFSDRMLNGVRSFAMYLKYLIL